jgi:ribosomal protein S12 methylthiotransferase
LKQKIGLVSLGCPKNLVDSEVMLGLAKQAGHDITATAEGADVVIVNTCAFIDRAKEESVNTILEMAELKKAGSFSRLVVTGCLAERYRDELRAEIPEIDAVLGTNDVPAIVDAIDGRGSAAAPAAPLRLFRGGDRPPTGAAFRGPSARHRSALPDRPLPTYLYDADTPRVRTTPRHYAYIKVAEGCDYNCSFCIIPTLRGEYRSRPVESIVREARSLADQGVRELLLISQDTTFYGLDRGDRDALVRLLRALDAVEDLRRVRLLYLYPTTLTDDVLDTMANSRRVCRYVDLPLQHSAGEVLRRMRRPGHRASYERLLARVRDRVPGVALRTTFIVGFPGETDADFDDLCAFVETVEFDHVGVFTYSHEEGTAACDLDDDVPEAVKRERQAHLMRLQRALVERRNAGRIGEQVSLIVDGPSAQHELVLQARLDSQAPEIDPVVYLTDCDPSTYGPGDHVEAEIVEAREYDLVARPLPTKPSVC